MQKRSETFGRTRAKSQWFLLFKIVFAFMSSLHSSDLRHNLKSSPTGPVEPEMLQKITTHIRNNDAAADGISIIRLTGVVSLCARWWISWKVGVAGILSWRDDDLSKAETGLLMLVGSKSSGCCPARHGAGWPLSSTSTGTFGPILPHSATHSHYALGCYTLAISRAGNIFPFVAAQREG
jgi:hypothetical protein